MLSSPDSSPSKPASYRPSDMQGVTAVALNAVSSSAPWLAAAQRVSKRTVRITVYELLPDVSLASQLHSMPTSQVYQADLTEPLLVKVSLLYRVVSVPNARSLSRCQYLS